MSWCIYHMSTQERVFRSQEKFVQFSKDVQESWCGWNIPWLRKSNKEWSWRGGLRNQLLTAAGSCCGFQSGSTSAGRWKRDKGRDLFGMYCRGTHRERRGRDGALLSTLLAGYQVVSGVQDKKLSPVLLPAWIQMLVLVFSTSVVMSSKPL